MQVTLWLRMFGLTLWLALLFALHLFIQAICVIRAMTQEQASCRAFLFGKSLLNNNCITQQGTKCVLLNSEAISHNQNVKNVNIYSNISAFYFLYFINLIFIDCYASSGWAEAQISTYSTQIKIKRNRNSVYNTTHDLFSVWIKPFSGIS